MGVLVMVVGKSGSGKSTSLRNFEDGEAAIFNVAGKPLPFRKRLAKADRCGYKSIEASLRANKLRAYVVDDSTYLMQFSNFAKAKESGYGKFVDMAVEFERLLEAAMATNDDTVVYFLHHPDVDERGNVKPKSIGRMLDEKLCIEGLFPIVINCEVRNGQHVFSVEPDERGIAKAPMDMFESAVFDNDLKAVDAAVREYWGMAPLSTGGGDAE
ncbi:MAG: hypothetical protein ACLUCU_09445 [Slackia sp.]